MSWFHRARDGQSPAGSSPLASAQADAGDDPAALGRTLEELNRFINRSAGRLPLRAVVEARRVTDTLREIIDTSAVRPLDVYALVAVRGTLEDYLPTTLRSYLAVDATLLDTPRSSGATPTQSLLEQLEALRTSAEATLVAARNQDADALMIQGNFLRTKFTGSDLDL